MHIWTLLFLVALSHSPCDPTSFSLRTSLSLLMSNSLECKRNHSLGKKKNHCACACLCSEWFIITWLWNCNKYFVSKYSSNKSSSIFYKIARARVFVCVHFCLFWFLFLLCFATSYIFSQGIYSQLRIEISPLWGLDEYLCTHNIHFRLFNNRLFESKATNLAQKYQDEIWAKLQVLHYLPDCHFSNREAGIEHAGVMTDLAIFPDRTDDVLLGGNTEFVVFLRHVVVKSAWKHFTCHSCWQNSDFSLSGYILYWHRNIPSSTKTAMFKYGSVSNRIRIGIKAIASVFRQISNTVHKFETKYCIKTGLSSNTFSYKSS